MEGVCDTPLQFLAEDFTYWGYSFKPCERSLPRIERTGVGAYRIRPSRERTIASSPLLGWMRYLFSFSPAWRAYAIRPYNFWRNSFLIGDILAWHTYCASRRTIGNFIFAAVEGVCDTPLQFLAEDFLFADYMTFLSSTASVEAKSLINVFICIFKYSKIT